MALVALSAVVLSAFIGGRGVWLSCYVYETKAHEFTARQRFFAAHVPLYDRELKDMDGQIGVYVSVLAVADSDWKRRDLKGRIAATEAKAKAFRDERESALKKADHFGALAAKYRYLARHPLLYAGPDLPEPK
jgi:hypothetical protein